MKDILQEFEQLLNQTYDQGLGGSIDLLLLQMPERKAEILRLCAIPHQFNTEVIKTLAPELSEEDAAELFSEFQNLSMTINIENDSAMHDEARAHLLDQWLRKSSEEFVEANQRLVDYFGSQLATAIGKNRENLRLLRMYHLIGVDQSLGFMEFDLIFEEMWHQYRMDECEHLIELARQYDAILQQQHRLYLTFSEGKLTAERGLWTRAEQHLSIVTAHDDAPEELKLMATLRMGILYATQRKWDRSIEILERALALSKSTESLADYVDDVMHEIGCVYRDRGELNRAGTILKEGLRIATEQNDLTTMALAYNSLGTLYRKMGDHLEATRMFEQCLEVLRENKDKFRPAQVYNNLGMTYADLRDWPQSEKYFKRSLDIKKEAGDTRGQANTLTNLARVYLNTDSESKAIESLTLATSLFRSIKDRYGQAVAKRSLAKIYRNTKQTELARQAYLEAIDLFHSVNQEKDAENANTELQALDGKSGMPWWAWLAIALFLVFLIVIVGVMAGF